MRNVLHVKSYVFRISKKMEMKREEQILFCAARRSNVASICENNFDWFLHGSPDTKYGKGLYGIEKLNKESQHLALLYTLLL